MKNIFFFDKSNIDALDNWRGVLSLIVCFAHITQILCSSELHSQKWMAIWGPLAHSAVLIFFFLSGYVIFFSLEKRFELKSEIISNIKSFFLARLFRIYPPLIGSIILILALKLTIKFFFKTLPPEFTFSLSDIIKYLLMIKVSLGNINAPLWSLIIEWWFYFLGFFIYHMFQKSLVYKIVSIATVLIILKLFLIKLNSEITIYFVIWLLGGLFQRYSLFSHKKVLLILSLSFCIYIVFIRKIYFLNIPIHKNPLDQLSIVISFIGFLFIFKKNRFLTQLSNFSYSIYIIHYPIIIFIKLTIYENGINNWFILFLIFLLLILTSYFFSKIFEKKF